MATDKNSGSPTFRAINESEKSDEDVLNVVRLAYGQIAKQEKSCCGPPTGSGLSASICCAPSVDDHAQQIGYSLDDLGAVPEGANLGLGCGNPTAIAELKPGEVIVDLGAGAGFDAFIAARCVGPTGRVIGVDMTPEMLERSRRLAVEAGVAGFVEFREGIISNLPVVDNSVDVVMSNCVINLVPNKRVAFREAFRVLKSGGRLAVSDILLSEPFPDELKDIKGLYVSCVSGALVAEEYFAAMRDAGFVEIKSTRANAGNLLVSSDDPLYAEAVERIGEERARAASASIWSYKINAMKP